MTEWPIERVSERSKERPIMRVSEFELCVCVREKEREGERERERERERG